MAAVTAVRRSAQTKPQPKPDEKKEQVKRSPIQRRANSSIPAYMQRRLALGTPGDAYEVEAEKVADHVGSGGLVGHTAPAIQRSPAPEEKPKSTVQRQPNSATPKREESKAPGGKVQRKEVDASSKYDDAKKKDLAATQKAGGAARGVQRKADANSPLADLRETKEHRKEDKRELLRSRPTISRSIQRQSTDTDGGTLDHAVENSIEQSRGSGTTLPTDVREGMEQQIGHDFSGVHIHHDAEAASLASEMHAQAFTVGHDIYFGQSQYQPHSDSGQHLLAHELTHVVQQSGGGEGVQRKLVQCAANTSASKSGNKKGKRLTAEETAAAKEQSEEFGKLSEDAKCIVFQSIGIPNYKLADKGTHKLIKRSKNYTGSRSTNQGAIWADGWKPAEMRSEITSRVSELTKIQSTDKETVKAVRTPGRWANAEQSDKSKGQYLIGNLEELSRAFALPMWDSAGKTANMEVDHIQELQLSGYPEVKTADKFENLQLLLRTINGTSGNETKARIREKAAAFLGKLRGEPPADPIVDYVLNHYDLVFSSATSVTQSDYDPEKHWTRDEVKNTKHLSKKISAQFEVKDTNDLVPETNKFGVFKNLSTGTRKLFDWNEATEVAKALSPSEKRDYIRGFEITDFKLQKPKKKKCGYFVLVPSKKHLKGSEFTIEIDEIGGLTKGGQITGFREELRKQKLEAKRSSPLEFNEVVSVGENLSPRATVTTDVPFLKNFQFDLGFGENDSLEVSANINSGAVNVPAPFSISDCGLTISASSGGELGVVGTLDFGIDGVGEGSLAARSSTKSAFEFDGLFNFDSKIFTKAELKVGYHDNEWSGSGELAIGEGKLRGIRSASVNATYAKGIISAEGTAQLSIPGVQQCSVKLMYSEKDGLTIGGRVELGNVAGLRSGSLDATVRKIGDDWKVAATGTAQPNIPGVNTTITVGYNDGMFTAEGTASYKNERLNGSLTVGVTNSPLGEDGKPTGQAPPDGPSELRVYGGGNLTLVITPWLQGTAGVRILPNGEIEVRGRLAVPQPLTIFDAKRWDRTLVSVGLDIPIFGMAVAGQRVGIFCTIGGDLKLVAGIGPAQLCNVALDVLYNPSHADKTTVTGTAAFYLPADAGLRLAVHAAIGAGIPIVSAQAGIELGAMLGLQASINAPLTITWSPTQGLDINQNIEAKLQPKFKFDVKGYLLVEANLFLTTVELYRKDWDLAKFELGSDFDLGLSMPFHYQEGKPFNPSMDDLKLTYPKVDPMELVRGLFEKIT